MHFLGRIHLFTLHSYSCYLPLRIRSISTRIRNPDVQGLMADRPGMVGGFLPGVKQIANVAALPGNGVVVYHM